MWRISVSFNTIEHTYTSNFAAQLWDAIVLYGRRRLLKKFRNRKQYWKECNVNVTSVTYQYSMWNDFSLCNEMKKLFNLPTERADERIAADIQVIIFYW